MSSVERSAAIGPASPWRATAWTVAAIALVPFALRTMLLLERASELGVHDLRGFLSDFAASLALSALVVPVGRIARPVALLLLVGWGLAHYANYETARVLGAIASASDAGYLGDSTFFFGSVVFVSSPVLLVVSLLVSLVLFWRVATNASIPLAFAAAALSGAAWLAHGAWSYEAQHARWRQIGVVQENLEAFAFRRSGPSESPFRDSQEAVLDLVPEMAADLSGEPIVEMPRPGMNVLLVLLESVSGLHVNTLAVDHGWRRAHVDMPVLDAIARTNLSYSSFFAHQRRTNRGLYSVLCGDLPTLRPALAKMTAYVDGGRVCLPEILRRAGYATVYLQAAPLAFMMKDQFMSRAGFERVHGNTWFDYHYVRSLWGVDDRAMFEQTLPLIEELQAGDRPWFLTLLTVGSHHPYLFPEGFRADLEHEEHRSLVYLDQALGPFFAELKKRGVLEDTLVVFTSDEASALGSPVSQNWGYLVVSTPDHAHGRVREAFGQVDLALSILDYVGLGEAGSHLFGRSVFRHYETPRWMFFANTNLGYVGGRSPEGELYFCSGHQVDCERYKLENDAFFGRSHAVVPSEPSDFDLVREVATRTTLDHLGESEEVVFDMMANPTVVISIPEGVPDQMIHGGQYVNLDVGEWVDVELVVHARGEPGAKTMLVHYLRARNHDPMKRWFLPIEAGQTVRLHYTFAPEEPRSTVQTRSYAVRTSDLPLELTFEVARMRYFRSGDPPESGFQIVELESPNEAVQ